jgi:hypothetical protein
LKELGSARGIRTGVLRRWRTFLRDVRASHKNTAPREAVASARQECWLWGLFKVAGAETVAQEACRRAFGRQMLNGSSSEAPPQRAILGLAHSNAAVRAADSRNRWAVCSRGWIRFGELPKIAWHDCGSSSRKRVLDCPWQGEQRLECTPALQKNEHLGVGGNRAEQV